MTRAEGSPGMTSVTNVVVFQHTGKLRLLYWQEGRDLWWQHELTNGVSADYSPEEMNAEDPLFILYTSPARPASERRGTTLY